MLSWECFFTQQQQHSHTNVRLVHGHPQGLLLWLGGRSDAPVTRWWSCVESLWIGGTWVYSPCVASAARKPTGEVGVGLGGSVLEEAHPCFPCFIQPWRWFHLLITLFEKNRFRTGLLNIVWNWRTAGGFTDSNVANVSVSSSNCCLYIGWQWRNFVPYLRQLVFAAIL